MNFFSVKEIKTVNVQWEFWITSKNLFWNLRKIEYSSNLKTLFELSQKIVKYLKIFAYLNFFNFYF